MESKFNLSKELCEKILTIFLLELNQTSKVTPAEKYYFKNLNQILKVDIPNFQRIKKESAAFRPLNPQDKVINLNQFFKEVLTTLEQVYPPDESEDILKYIIVSMDCSSHFTLESLDHLLLQQQSSSSTKSISQEEDFFTDLNQSSEPDIIEDTTEIFELIEEEVDEPILPPIVTELSSIQTIALPKKNIDNNETISQEQTQASYSDPDSTTNETSIDSSIPLNESADLKSETDAKEELVEEVEQKTKKSKFKLPKLSLDAFVPLLIKHLQKPSDLIIEKLNLTDNSESAIIHPKFRALAATLDTITLIPIFVVSIPITILLATIGLGIIAVLLQLVLSLIIVFYYFKMETSKYQGTIGKILCGIKIVNQENQPMTNKQAIIRNLFKFSPMLLSNVIAIIVMVISIPLLGLLSTIASLAVTLGICYAFINKNKQGVHDILAKTYVIGKLHDLPSNLETQESAESNEENLVE